MTVGGNVTIDGCNGAVATAPCVNLTSSILNFMLDVPNIGSVTISGLAFHAGISRETSGIRVRESNAVVLTNDWFGMRTDGVQSDLSTDVMLVGSDAVTVGGSTEAERNAFVSSNTGVLVQGSGTVTIAGNRFSTNAAGTGTLQGASGVGLVDSAIVVKKDTVLDQPSQNVTIGGALSLAQAGTVECDGPCNVIGADTRGIDLQAASFNDVNSVNVLGNHIGVLTNGTTAVTQTGTDAINLGGAGNVDVGNGSATGRNVIAGSWQNGVVDPDATGQVDMVGNYVSIDATGAAALPVAVTGITVGGSSSSNAYVRGNRVSADPTSGVAMRVAQQGAFVYDNTLGIGIGGENLPMYGGIVVTGDGNFVGSYDGGDGNVVCGARQSAAVSVTGNSNAFSENWLGVRRDGTDCTGTSANFSGFRISGTAASNALGQYEEVDNVISNSDHEAILVDTTGVGNTIKRVSGSNNAEQFLDISTTSAGDGPGGGAGRNGSVALPTLGLSGTAGSNGTGIPGAEIRVFRTNATAGSTPTGIVGTIGYATVGGDGTWVASYPSNPIPKGSRVTILQTKTDGSSSELTVAKVAQDTTPPTATFTSGPTGRVGTATPTFTFTGTDETPPVTFDCAIDNAPRTTCTSPFTTAPLADGAHTLALFPTDGMNIINTSPAQRTFTVDTTPPDATTLVGVPAAKLAATTATVTFTGPTDTASFQCSLDSAAFAACTSPIQLTGLAQGAHTFRVRALDDVGNADATPAATSFTVDTVAPKVAFTPAATWTVSTKGGAAPKLRCIDVHVPCSVKVTIATRTKVQLGAAKPKVVTFHTSTVSIGGTSKAVQLKLSKVGAAALATLGGTAKVRVSFVVTDAWGNVTRSSSLLTLAPVPPKRR